MTHQDRFGNPIYPHVHSKMREIGRQLVALGYSEHTRKPDLYVCSHPSVTFYADLRGTAMVPIWEDTSALFYWRFSGNLPLTLRRRMLAIETMRLRDVPWRVSGEMHEDYEIAQEFPLQTSGDDPEGRVQPRLRQLFADDILADDDLPWYRHPSAEPLTPPPATAVPTAQHDY